jgi:Rieske Fe-S protein
MRSKLVLCLLIMVVLTSGAYAQQLPSIDSVAVVEDKLLQPVQAPQQKFSAPVQKFSSPVQKSAVVSARRPSLFGGAERRAVRRAARRGEL